MKPVILTDDHPAKLDGGGMGVPTGAMSKSGLWVPEWNRYFSAVPQHFVLTAPHGSKDIRTDLRNELNQKDGTVLPILSNLMTEPAHLMVFDYLP
jgi:hypothetical protein